MLRCVPRVDREEFLNVGVVALLPGRATTSTSPGTSTASGCAALDPGLDLDQVCDALAFVDGVCAGDERGGAAGTKPLGQRFGFLRAPKSTVLQPGPVHGGVTTDPAAELDRLLAHLVH